VDIDDPALEAPDEGASEHLHEAGEHDQVD
jgi:hypothetical protein